MALSRQFAEPVSSTNHQNQLFLYMNRISKRMRALRHYNGMYGRAEKLRHLSDARAHDAPFPRKYHEPYDSSAVLVRCHHTNAVSLSLYVCIA